MAHAKCSHVVVRHVGMRHRLRDGARAARLKRARLRLRRQRWRRAVRVMVPDGRRGRGRRCDVRGRGREAAVTSAVRPRVARREGVACAGALRVVLWRARERRGRQLWRPEQVVEVVRAATAGGRTVRHPERFIAHVAVKAKAGERAAKHGGGVHLRLPRSDCIDVKIGAAEPGGRLGTATLHPTPVHGLAAATPRH